jgi:hypothetical protein
MALVVCESFLTQFLDPRLITKSIGDDVKILGDPSRAYSHHFVTEFSLNSDLFNAFLSLSLGINIRFSCQLITRKLITTKSSVTVFVLSAIAIIPCFYNGLNAQQAFKERDFLQTESKPSVADPYLKVELVVGGLDTPTTMTFLEVRVRIT